MRPLTLKLKGFTAFREEAEFDFTQFDVFAISGPTGSGKSSLLDAMTYALYGRVERVGDRVSQLISQGQPSMSVTLEFEVGAERFRVTRRTPAKGATKILLERQDPGGEWQQAGEGADRVREAEPMIERAIGLTYDGFTRSVMLPQGQFAEFLVGDARKRRDILIELLGLSLFRRMAERAGGIAKESAIRSDTIAGMLERDYGDATPEALHAARTCAQTAEARERALVAAAERVAEILERGRDARRSMEELRAVGEEISAAAGQAGTAAEELDQLAGRFKSVVEEMDGRTAASAAAQESLDHAKAELRQAEEAAGSTGELTKAQARALALREAGAARAQKAEQLSQVTGSAENLASAATDADLVAAEHRHAVTGAETATTEAEAALERARHADLVAAVSSGLTVGDPCPVCGTPLATAPKTGTAGSLEAAEGALHAAKRGFDTAANAAAQAERAADAAHRDVEANEREQARLDGEIADVDARIADERAALETLLGSPLPDDPAAAIDERLAELHRLDRAERDATTLSVEAANALLVAEQERERTIGSIERQRDRLVVDRDALVDRATRATARAVEFEAPPAPPEAAEARVLAQFGHRLAEALAVFAERLAAAMRERASLEQILLNEAATAVVGLIEPAPTLEVTAQAVAAARTAATADTATATHRAADLGERIERKRRFREEVHEHDDRARLFRALAQELRADRLVAFLQAEALQLLAAAGSERLASLSDGRYRLVCRDDEFLVVDTWNGDEERSVRTLSGGETFLASLALALALADQVRSLSTTDRARLDSLFLDEGFGTLDAEALGTVVDAIELLAGDGRLVGVITHVRELAERFPHIEVEKSPKGSKLKLVLS